jgi:hypothetical protein
MTHDEREEKIVSHFRTIGFEGFIDQFSDIPHKRCQ